MVESLGAIRFSCNCWNFSDTFVFLFIVLCCDVVMQAIELVKYLMADMKSLLHMGGVSFQQLFGQRI